MTTMKVRWTIADPATVLLTYNRCKVYRSTVGPAGPWVEATAPGTLVTIVAGVTQYLFDDAAGSLATHYAYTYYHATGPVESAKMYPDSALPAGYCTVEDVRAEGFTATEVTDAQVLRGIARATAMIERVTGRWFEPRVRTFVVDAPESLDLELEHPIIAVTGIKVDDVAVTLSDLLVFNRVLTQGLLDPDDRDRPRIRYTDDATVEDPYYDESLASCLRPWGYGHRSVSVTGVFGYTDPDPLITPAETGAGTQVPVSYGVVPELIKQAALLLTARYMWTLASSAGQEFTRRGGITGETTRDQSYTRAVRPGDAAYGWTGDMEVDGILQQFRRQLRVGSF